MLLITGATGNLGSSVINQLQQHLSKKDFIVTSSSSEGVQKLLSHGYNARLANFNNLTSLNEAFQGITKLLLISTMGQNRFEQHKNVIDIAKIRDVKHVIYTSLAIKNIETSAVKDLMISHLQTEEYIIKSGIKYTILRNTMYADALKQILGTKGLVQDISLPGGNGKIPYALRREMGEATANLLLQSGHENAIYDITGSQTLGYADLAKEVQALSGIVVNYNDISEQVFSENLKAAGFSDFEIYLHTGTIQDIKNHQYEIQSSTLESLLGRPTTNANAFLKEVLIQWKT